MPKIANRMKILSSLTAIALVVTVMHSAVVTLPAEPAFAAEPLVTVSDGREEVRSGGSLVYQIGLRSGSSENERVDVEFVIPDFVRLTRVSDEGRQQGGVVRWNGLNIYPGADRFLQVEAEVLDTSVAGDRLVAAVRAAGVTAVDETIVLSERTNRFPLNIYVSDKKVYAEPEEELHYEIVVDNSYGDERTFDLHTYLPQFLRFQNATGHFRREQRQIVWDDQTIGAGERAVYDLYAIIDREAPEHTTLKLTASSDTAKGSDSTTVLLEQLPPAALNVTISDGHETAVTGEELTYTILIDNNQDKLATSVDVVGALPLYGEFVSATEGGAWTGKEVYWKGLTISPYGKRTLNVTYRVRSDAPLGADFRASVRALGRQAVDVTTIDTVSRGHSDHVANNNVLLRKRADRSEVRPGDTITYSVFLKNTFSHDLRNVRIEDRLDMTYAEIVDAQRGQMIDGRLVWTVPVLAPGQEWSVDYTVRVLPHAPHGVEVANVVTVSADGMESVSLTERVRTSQISVVGKLPPAGAPLDVIFGSFIGLLAGVQTFAQRRRLLLS